MKPTKSLSVMVACLMCCSLINGVAAGKAKNIQPGKPSFWGRLYLDRSSGSIQYLLAKFGQQPKPGLYPVVFPLPPDGCLTYSPAVQQQIARENAIVALERGNCTFTAKARIAQSSNASSVIVFSEDDNVFQAPGLEADDVKIGVVMIRKSAGEMLKAAAREGVVRCRLVPMTCEGSDKKARMRNNDACVPVVQADGQEAEKLILTGGELHAATIEEINDLAAVGTTRKRARKDILSTEFVTAEFGGPLISDSLVVIPAEPLDGCSSLNIFAEKYDLTHKAILVERGGCSFLTKVSNIQDAGGAMAIVADNGYGMNRMKTQEKFEAYNITIPAVMVSQRAGRVLSHQNNTVVAQFASSEKRVAELWKSLSEIPVQLAYLQTKQEQQDYLEKLLSLHQSDGDRMEMLSKIFASSGGDKGLLAQVATPMLNRREEL